MEYYKQSTLTGTGGGWLGGVLTSFLTIGLEKPGTFLVLVVLFIICMVCITERSFVSAVKRGGDKAYQYAREDMDRRRELHAIREEERRRIREEQRVRGVNLNATRLMTPEEEDYDEEAFDREFGADLEEMPEMPEMPDTYEKDWGRPRQPAQRTACRRMSLWAGLTRLWSRGPMPGIPTTRMNWGPWPGL